MHNPVPNPLGLLHNDADTLLAQQVFGRRVSSSSSSSSSSVVNLDDLGDVVITSPATGAVLQYTGFAWADFDLLNAANTWGAANTFSNGVVINAHSSISSTSQLRFGDSSQRIAGDSSADTLTIGSVATNGTLILTAGANSCTMTLGEFDFGGGALYPKLTPVSSSGAGSQNIAMQIGGLYLADGNVPAALYFANSTFSNYCYFQFTTSTSELLFGNGNLIISRSGASQLRFYGVSNVSAAARRGGETFWYHGSSGSQTLKGVLFVNDNSQLVFDTSQQASQTDTGNAYVDFSNGNALFAGLTLTSLSTVNRILYTTTSGALTYSGNLTFNGSVLTVTGSVSVTSNIACAGVLQDGSAQNMIDFIETGTANYFRFYNAATGNPVQIRAHGSDTNVGMDIYSRGVGSVTLKDGSGVGIFQASPVTSGQNYIFINNAVAGSPPIMSVTGETDVGFNIQTSGTGELALCYGTTKRIIINDNINVTSNLRIQTVGKGLLVKEGSNATMGSSTLTAGAVTVSTTAVTASSRIFLTNNTLGGTAGFLRVSARTAGTSFTITSSNGADTSTIAWLIVEPA